MERFFDFFSWLLKVLSYIGVLAGFYTWFTLSVGGISNLANKKLNKKRKFQGFELFIISLWMFVACIVVLVNRNSLVALVSFVGFGIYFMWDSRKSSGRLSKLTFTVGCFLLMPAVNALWVSLSKAGG